MGLRRRHTATGGTDGLPEGHARSPLAQDPRQRTLLPVLRAVPDHAGGGGDGPGVGQGRVASLVSLLLLSAVKAVIRMIFDRLDFCYIAIFHYHIAIYN